MTSRSEYREYDFPNAKIRVYSDRTCLEFPKWCAMIHAKRSRQYVAEALRELRVFRRRPAEELTAEGVQLVIPGTEKRLPATAKQMELW